MTPTTSLPDTCYLFPITIGLGNTRISGAPTTAYRSSVSSRWKPTSIVHRPSGASGRISKRCRCAITSPGRNCLAGRPNPSTPATDTLLTLSKCATIDTGASTRPIDSTVEARVALKAGTSSKPSSVRPPSNRADRSAVSAARCARFDNTANHCGDGARTRSRPLGRRQPWAAERSSRRVGPPPGTGAIEGHQTQVGAAEDNVDRTFLDRRPRQAAQANGLRRVSIGGDMINQDRPPDNGIRAAMLEPIEGARIVERHALLVAGSDRVHARGGIGRDEIGLLRWRPAREATWSSRRRRSHPQTRRRMQSAAWSRFNLDDDRQQDAVLALRRRHSRAGAPIIQAHFDPIDAGREVDGQCKIVGIDDYLAGRPL